jgi:hypothetical protein
LTAEQRPAISQVELWGYNVAFSGVQDSSMHWLELLPNTKQVVIESESPDWNWLESKEDVCQ